MAQVPPSSIDAEVIRFIIVCIVRKDRAALREAGFIKGIEKAELFWKDVESYPFRFIDPPREFFLHWDSHYSKTTNFVRFEGPMWSVEQQPTFDVYLLIDKDLNGVLKPFLVRGLRPN